MMGSVLLQHDASTLGSVGLSLPRSLNSLKKMASKEDYEEN